MKGLRARSDESGVISGVGIGRKFRSSVNRHDESGIVCLALTFKMADPGDDERLLILLWLFILIRRRRRLQRNNTYWSIVLLVYRHPPKLTFFALSLKSLQFFSLALSLKGTGNRNWCLDWLRNPLSLPFPFTLFSLDRKRRKQKRKRNRKKKKLF